MYTLNCKGRLLVIEKPVVMGILNLTPDSFYSGSRVQEMEQVLQRAGQMIHEGAVILDIGGQSTRPGSNRISAEEELQRVLPAIKSIKEKYPSTFLSIDTYHSTVAKEAVDAGADMVNDISAGEMDKQMLSTVAALNVPYIAMHMKGTPETMQQNANYEDVTKEVVDYFIHKVDACKNAGIKDIIIDPGFGFAKTIEHNFQLLKKLEVLNIFNLPVLAGISRKATIYKTLQLSPEESLNGTTVLNTIAISKGASVLRVHDVKEAMQVINLYDAFSNA